MQEYTYMTRHTEGTYFQYILWLGSAAHACFCLFPSQSEMNFLKEEVSDQKPKAVGDVDYFRIILVGQVGAGKSSFFNTVSSIYRCRIVSKARTGGLAGAKSLTTAVWLWYTAYTREHDVHEHHVLLTYNTGKCLGGRGDRVIFFRRRETRREIPLGSQATTTMVANSIFIRCKLVVLKENWSAASHNTRSHRKHGRKQSREEQEHMRV